MAIWLALMVSVTSVAKAKPLAWDWMSLRDSETGLLGAGLVVAAGALVWATAHPGMTSSKELSRTVDGGRRSLEAMVIDVLPIRFQTVEL
jgi:hypothetical protein